MGKQVDKSRKKLLSEVKDNNGDEMAKPFADEKRNVEKSSVFSCGNLVLILFTVVVAIIVASVITKGVELQRMNLEQDQTIKQLKTDSLEQEQTMKQINEDSLKKDYEMNQMRSDMEKLQSSITKFLGKAKSDDVMINSLQVENEGLEKKIKELSLEVESNMEIANELRKNGIALEKNCDVAFEKLKLNKEEEVNKLNEVVLQKEDEIKVSTKSIESLKGQITSLTDEKLQLSQHIESMKALNAQISEELTSKSKTIKSLNEQNKKLSVDMSSLRDETSQELGELEEEKKQCLEKSEIDINSCKEEIQGKEISLKQLEDVNNNLEKTLKEKVFDLESEHKIKLKVLEDIEANLRELLKSEQEDKNDILEEKASKDRALDNLQLEKEQASHNLKMSRVNLEKCNTEKGSESGRRKVLENKVDELNQEINKLEDECRLIRDKLAQSELKEEK